MAAASASNPGRPRAYRCLQPKRVRNLDVYHYLTLARDRIGLLDKLQHLRTAKPADHRDTHNAPSPRPRTDSLQLCYLKPT
ncbi:hypothetical protein Psuf_054300 [Phytohabitans suffuscus]|uniref:Uncharacterized protein n=1 Tax=Phytohabitans suffuscus TaxID=624315 RepID=A0A6F8YPQ9_9ACTN|nr:hypothetical protein Psuf_054300 [Phytohabitans suffuscus]